MLFGTNCAKKNGTNQSKERGETKTPLSPSACTGSRLPVLTRTGGKRTLQRPKTVQSWDGVQGPSFFSPVLAGQIEYEMQVLVMIVLFIVLSRNKLRIPLEVTYSCQATSGRDRAAKIQTSR